MFSFNTVEWIKRWSKIHTSRGKELFDLFDRPLHGCDTLEDDVEEIIESRDLFMSMLCAEDLNSWRHFFSGLVMRLVSAFRLELMLIAAGIWDGGREVTDLS